jgi:hypothetical protein
MIEFTGRNAWMIQSRIDELKKTTEERQRE